MFGFIPPWALWTTVGWAVSKVGGSPQQPGQPGQTPAATPAAQAGAPVAPQPPVQRTMGPPAPRPGPKCQYDAHMPEQVERAVTSLLTKAGEAMQAGNASEAKVVANKLRGFATHITDAVPATHYPSHYFPVAAHVMRATATFVEGQLAAQQVQSAAASATAAAPIPSPVPTSAAKANGTAAPAAPLVRAEVVETVEH